MDFQIQERSSKISTLRIEVLLFSIKGKDFSFRIRYSDNVERIATEPYIGFYNMQFNGMENFSPYFSYRCFQAIVNTVPPETLRLDDTLWRPFALRKQVAEELLKNYKLYQLKNEQEYNAIICAYKFDFPYDYFANPLLRFKINVIRVETEGLSFNVEYNFHYYDIDNTSEFNQCDTNTDDNESVKENRVLPQFRNNPYMQIESSQSELEEDEIQNVICDYRIFHNNNDDNNRHYYHHDEVRYQMFTVTEDNYDNQLSQEEVSYQVDRPISRQVQNIHPDFLNTNTEPQVQHDNSASNDNTNDQDAEKQPQKCENLSKEGNDDFYDFCRKLAQQLNNQAEENDDFRNIEHNDILQFNIENNEGAELNFQADIPQFNIENNQDPELNSQVQVYNQDNFYISTLFDQENENFNITVVSESNFNHTCNYIN